MTDEFDDFPPKNRKAQSLPILEIRITSKDKTLVNDPNSNIVMVAGGAYPKMEPIPGLISEISGKPAYKIETDNLELHLSFDEMDRFFRHDLEPSEYYYLRDKYGMFFDIHNDFYTEDSGEAWQPVKIARSTAKRIKAEEMLNEEKKSSSSISADIIAKTKKP